MRSNIQGYSVEEILIDTYYRSSIRRGNEGVIVEAVKRDDVYVSRGDVYAVRVRPQYFAGRAMFSDFWATIAVNN
jgi:hypothetical protein